MEENTKVCSKCGVEKEFTQFYFNKKTGYYLSICLECTKIIVRSEEYKKYQKNYRNSEKGKDIRIKNAQSQKAKDRRKNYRENNKSKFKDMYRKVYGEKGRNIHLISKYNITETEYSVLFEKQNGVCLICKLPQRHKTMRNLCVDHDHTTGNVRGLLCYACNIKLGWYERNKHKVIYYLSRGHHIIENL